MTLSSKCKTIFLITVFLLFTYNVFAQVNSAESGFYISQSNGDSFENIYYHQFEVEYSTEEFVLNAIEGKITLRIVQTGLPFADIDMVKLVACGQEATPEYARYVGSNESLIDDIHVVDYDVVFAHESELEISWILPEGCLTAKLFLNANEYNHANPLSFPQIGNAGYEMGSNVGSIFVDGNVGETENSKPVYAPLWSPSTGHPEGYTYIYICDDTENVFFSLDVTADNTNEYGEDWAEITIITSEKQEHVFRIDDFDNTWGKTAFGKTNKVSYKHQSVEFRIPKDIIGNESFEFRLRYYGTAGVNGITWLGRFAENLTDDGSVNGSIIATYNPGAAPGANPLITDADSDNPNLSSGRNLKGAQKGVDVDLPGDCFADPITLGVNISVTNVPPGMTAVVTRLNDLQVGITLTGNAINHAHANDVNNLTITFLNGAFVSTPIASNVNGYLKNDGIIDFIEAPVLAAIEAGNLSYTEGDGSKQITASITVSDADDLNIESAVVQITGNYQNGEDVLEFTNTPNITGTWDVGTGKMTLNGTDTKANYQAALRSVTYNNTSNNPVTSLLPGGLKSQTRQMTATPRTVGFTVNDGDLNSNTESRVIDLTSVNSTPVLAAIEGANLAYSEGDGSKQITATLTVTDVDDTNIESAIIQITGNYQNGEDVLEFTNTANIIGTWDVGNGKMTLNGSDTKANYQSALRSVTYRNTSSNPTTLISAGGVKQPVRKMNSTPRTASFIVNDGDGDSNTETRIIDLTAVNNVPVLAAIEGANLAYTEGDGSKQITATLTVSDADDTNIENAVVQITGNYQNGEDVLEFIDTPNITGTWDVANGKMTLNGTDTKANYQAALRSVTYKNTSDNPVTLILPGGAKQPVRKMNATPRTVSFTVNDGDGNSNTETRIIDLSAANDLPVLAAIEGANLVYSEGDGSKQITAAITLTDADDMNIESAVVQITGNYQKGEDVLEFTNTANIAGTWDAPNGKMTLNGSDTKANYQAALRSVTYKNTSDNPVTRILPGGAKQPVRRMNATPRTVSFTVNDGDGDSNAETRIIDLTAVNDFPALAAIEGANLAYSEGDGSKQITAAITVADADDTNIEGAVVQITGNYQNGEDVLEFTNTANITGTWDVANGKMVLNGTDTKANYQTALRSVTYKNTSSNPTTLVMPGGVKTAGRKMTATPRTVSFTVNDGDADSNTETRIIDVTAVNDAPVLASIEGANLAYTEGDGSKQITATLTVSDADDINIENAIVQITGNYQNGEDVLEFTNTANITGTWDVANGKMTLNGTDTKANYQTALRSVTYKNTSSNPTTQIIPGGVKTAGRKMTATPRTVSFTVNDGDTGSNAETRIIDLSAVNDIPVLAAIEGGNLAYSEGDGSKQITATLTVTDADDTNIESAVVQITGNYQNGEDVLGFTNTVNIIGTWDVVNGKITLNGTDTKANYQAALRSVTYKNTSDNPVTLILPGGAKQPVRKMTATPRTVSFTVNDGDGDSNTETRIIDLTAVNDVPLLAAIEVANLAYSEGDGSKQITATLTVTDADDTNVENAIVQITGNYQNGEDVLEFTNTANIIGTWDVANGKMTLNGTDTKANYQTALRSVTYKNTSSNPTTLILPGGAKTAGRKMNATPRTVSFTVNDGDGDSNTETRIIDLSAVNNVPVLAAIEVANLAYTEGDGSKQITAAITVTDADDTNIESAVIQITGNYQKGEDVLEFTNTANITGTWDAPNGKMTLNGTDTKANYQTALRSVTYKNTSSNPTTLILPGGVKTAGRKMNATPRTVSFTVNDGDGDSNAETRIIDLSAVNDLPVLAAIEGANLAYSEGDGSKQITAAITVADADDTNIESAVVQITGNYQNGEDVLEFTNTANITGTWNAANGKMTLNGTDTKANYQAALRSVTYKNTSDNPVTFILPGGVKQPVRKMNATPRTVSFIVNDGDGDSNAETRIIDLTAVNDLPALAAIEGSNLVYYEGDGSKQITATLTVTDADDTNIESAVIQITGNYQNGEDVLEFTNTANITGTWDVANGKMTLNGTDTKANYQTALRSVTYKNTSSNPTTLLMPGGVKTAGRKMTATPRTVSFTINDGDLDSNIEMRIINILSLSNIPIVKYNEGATVAEGGSVTIYEHMLLYTDPQQTSYLLYTLLTPPEHGVLKVEGNIINRMGTFTQKHINNFELTYEHDGSETTVDLFEFKVSDSDKYVTQVDNFIFTIKSIIDPPAKPTQVTSSYNENGDIIITWYDNSGNELGFYVWRQKNTPAKLNAVNDYELIATLPSDTEEFVDENTEEGAGYTYQIEAFNNDGSSGVAAGSDGGLIVLAPLNRPTNLNAVNNGNGTITIQWDDNSSLETEYKIVRAVNSTWSELQTLGENATSFTDTNVEEGTTYHYRVKAINTETESVFSNECSATCTITNVDDWTNGAPTEFTLHQNYPNPFNPSTTIRYALPEGSNVKLIVYNLLGQEVAVLVNQYQNSGYHEVVFEAGNNNSGIYLYKIIAGDFVEIKKCALMK